MFDPFASRPSVGLICHFVLMLAAYSVNPSVLRSRLPLLPVSRSWSMLEARWIRNIAFFCFSTFADHRAIMWQHTGSLNGKHCRSCASAQTDSPAMLHTSLGIPSLILLLPHPRMDL